MDDQDRELLAAIEPRKPLAPPGAYLAGFALVFLATVAAGVLRFGPLAMRLLSGGTAALVLGTLSIAAVLLMMSLAGQMAPGSRQWIPPSWLLAGTLIMLAAVFALSFPVEPVPGFWRAAWNCFSAGLLIAAPAALLVWLLLRRGAFLSPRIAGATAGLLAGLAGTTMLEIHCPILSAPHILIAHLGAPLVGAILGVAAASAVRPRHTGVTPQTAKRAESSSTGSTPGLRR